MPEDSKDIIELLDEQIKKYQKKEPEIQEDEQKHPLFKILLFIRGKDHSPLLKIIEQISKSKEVNLDYIEKAILTVYNVEENKSLVNTYCNIEFREGHAIRKEFLSSEDKKQILCLVEEAV